MGLTVVVVDGDEVAELEMARKGRSLRGDTLHQATVTEEDIGVVVDELEAVLVVTSSKVGLGDGETNPVGDTLTEGTSGDLNTIGNTSLGVAWGDAVELTEVLQVIDGDLVAQKVEESVLEGAARINCQIEH